MQGNSAGVALGGTIALANTFDAVALFAGASGNTIGGTAASTSNVLSGNGRFGVFLSDAGTSGNVVQGNFIGVNRSGTLLANGSDGVSVLSGASGNTIGGTLAAAANVISGNGRAGVVLGVHGTSNNLVEGNMIGTNAAGTAAVPNVVSGVAIVTGAAGNTIGGTATGADNLISGNTGTGIEMEESATTGNVVQGNLIGTTLSGTTALGNGTDGIFLHFGASTNTIGGTGRGSGASTSSPPARRQGCFSTRRQATSCRAISSAPTRPRRSPAWATLSAVYPSSTAPRTT